MSNLTNKVVTHMTLHVDQAAQNSPAYIYAKQYDANSRYLVVRLMHGSRKLNVQGIAQLNAIRPDGKKIPITGTNNADGTITIGLTASLLSIDGKVSCDLSVTSSGENGQTMLTTSTFFIMVDKSNYDADATDDEDTPSSQITGLTTRTEGEVAKIYLSKGGEPVGDGAIIPSQDVTYLKVDDRGMICVVYEEEEVI